MRRPVDRKRLGTMTPGQDLTVVGFIGTEGTRAVTEAKLKELSQWFSRDYLEQILSYREIELSGNLMHWSGFGVTECEMIGEGGILAALWNLSGSYDVGIEFTLQQIPVKQETIEICERFELNPYRLISGNCVLLVADQGYQLVRKLAAQGIPAAVIGQVNLGFCREVYNGETKGFMERPGSDEVLKMIPGYFDKCNS